MTTYTWQFPTLYVYPTYQTVTNAVFSVEWQLIGDDGAGHVATASGIQALGPIDTGNFIPFANLTKSIVQSWVEAQMGSTVVNGKRTALDQQIANQIAPAVRVALPPWP